MAERRVLFADATIASVSHLVDGLVLARYSCVIATDRERALETVRNQECDVAICDVQVAGTGKFELLEAMKTLRPDLPVIVGADGSSTVDASEAVKRGAFQYVEKPFAFDKLYESIVRATTQARSSAAIDGSSHFCSGARDEELVSASASMRELEETIALVARSDAPILILGESGTGKERVARAIHARGQRASRAFVAVNTSSIPEALLESEIFGNNRDNFGALPQLRRGLLSEADGGTLLLDEIADMPIMLQPKLLRVLQFRETRPVGCDRFEHVDARVIAATNRDLGRLVHEGRFREDLHHRLNVIPLVVPPLRSRREDITPLVSIFLAAARQRTAESPVKAFSEEAMDILTRATWVGNVRELKNTVERMVVLGREPVVKAQDLRFLHERSAGNGRSLPRNASWSLKQMNVPYLDWLLRRTACERLPTASLLEVEIPKFLRWARRKF